MIPPVFIGKAFLLKDNKLVKSERLKVAELVEAPSPLRQAQGAYLIPSFLYSL